MDTAPNDVIVPPQSKAQTKAQSFLPDVAKKVIDAEVNCEYTFNEQRRNALSFSQDALECSATSPNMSSASLKAKKIFSISGKSSPLSASASSSPKSIRITEVEEDKTTSIIKKTF